MQEGKKVVKNASWIIGCKIVKAVLTFVITAITARYLGTADYGLINYAASLVAFVAPIMQLGFSSTMVHEIVSRPEEEGKVIGTTVTLNLISALFCIVGIFAFTSIVNASETETIVVSTIYSVLLLFQALEMIHYWFQAKLLAKFSAIAMLVAYIVVAVFQTLLVVYNVSIYYFALSYSIDYFVISSVLFIVYKKKGGQKIAFSFALAKEMFKVSKYYILSNLMEMMFLQTGKIIIKLMLGNSATGIYSAAGTLASMTSFIFAAILDSMRPVIFEAKKQQDQVAFEERCKDLYGIIIYFSLAQCVAITLLSPFLVWLMFGDGYVEAAAVLRVMVWFTTFSYLGSVRNIWILSEGHQKYLWIINMSGAIVNIVLTLVFITFMGLMGAALASVITQIVTNIVVNYLIKPIRPVNKLMWKSLNPKRMLSFIKMFTKK